MILVKQNLHIFMGKQKSINGPSCVVLVIGII